MNLSVLLRKKLVFFDEHYNGKAVNTSSRSNVYILIKRRKKKQNAEIFFGKFSIVCVSFNSVIFVRAHSAHTQSNLSSYLLNNAINQCRILRAVKIPFL